MHRRWSNDFGITAMSCVMTVLVMAIKSSRRPTAKSNWRYLSIEDAIVLAEQAVHLVKPYVKIRRYHT